MSHRIDKLLLTDQGAPAFADLVAENHRLMRALLEAQERERGALARDLHDELSQHMTAIRAHAAAIARAPGDVEGNSSRSAAIENSASLVYRASHDLMRALHPRHLVDTGLADALAELVAEWSARHPGLALKLRIASDATGESGAVRLALFRVAQECLSNIAGHAGAGRVRVYLRWLREPSGVPVMQLVVRDDGAGLHGAQPGLGLLGMRERVRMLGGSLVLVSRDGAGTRVRARVPAGA